MKSKISCSFSVLLIALNSVLLLFPNRLIHNGYLIYSQSAVIYPDELGIDKIDAFGYLKDSGNLNIQYVKPYIMYSTDSIEKISENVKNRGDLRQTKYMVKLLNNNKYFEFSPVLNSRLAIGNGTSYNHQLGAKIQFNLNEKFHTNVKAWHVSTNLPQYQAYIYDTLPVFPHDGMKTKAVSYSYNLSYSPVSYLNFQIAKDRQMIGEGYRSVFLSDYAPPYNFFKINVLSKRIQFVYNLSLMKDYNRYAFNNGLFNKYMVYHLLNIKATNKLQFQLFESITAQTNDSLGHNGIDPNYLNPLVFYRHIEYGLGSAENAMIGFGMTWDFFNYFKFYSQLMLDEFTYSQLKQNKGYKGNKNALQLGLQYEKYFYNNSNENRKLKYLLWRIEHNKIRPFTFIHYSGLQIYSHMHHALAHPMGLGFREYLLQFKAIGSNKFELNVKSFIIEYGSNPEGEDFGNDLYASDIFGVDDFGYETISGIKNSVNINDVSLSYVLVSNWNLKLNMGFLSYFKFTPEYDNEFHFYIGLSTSDIFNRKNYFVPR